MDDNSITKTSNGTNTDSRFIPRFLVHASSISANCNRFRFLGILSILTLLFALLNKSIYSFNYPYHASCSVRWHFGRECTLVKSRIIHQIALWDGSAGCEDGGQKCLYKLTEYNSMSIRGTHTTPIAHYVDTFSFNLTQRPNDICQVEAFSSAELWYAVLDFGTNYCNLYNLVEGAGLTTDDRQYAEFTSNSICTQYSSRDCAKY